MHKFGPCYTTGQGAGGDIFPQSSCFCCPLPLGSSSGSQPHPSAPCALLGQCPEPGSGCSAQTCSKGSFSPAPAWYHPNNTQVAGVTHNKEQGEDKQINSKILVNERPTKSCWSSALLHSTSPCRHRSKHDQVLTWKMREVASFHGLGRCCRCWERKCRDGKRGRATETKSPSQGNAAAGTGKNPWTWWVFTRR